MIPSFVDQPVFAERETRFRGEAVAAIVGEAGAVAAIDLTAFPVSWTELPALTTIEAVNPCAQTISGYIGVRDRKSGDTFQLAFNVSAGSNVTVHRHRLERQGLNKRLRSTNSFGSASSGAVAAPGVVLVDFLRRG